MSKRCQAGDLVPHFTLGLQYLVCKWLLSWCISSCFTLLENKSEIRSAFKLMVYNLYQESFQMEQKSDGWIMHDRCLESQERSCRHGLKWWQAEMVRMDNRNMHHRSKGSGGLPCVCVRGVQWMWCCYHTRPETRWVGGPAVYGP